MKRFTLPSLNSNRTQQVVGDPSDQPFSSKTKTKVRNPLGSVHVPFALTNALPRTSTKQRKHGAAEQLRFPCVSQKHLPPQPPPIKKKKKKKKHKLTHTHKKYTEPPSLPPVPDCADGIRRRSEPLVPHLPGLRGPQMAPAHLRRKLPVPETRRAIAGRRAICAGGPWKKSINMSGSDKLP